MLLGAGSLTLAACNDFLDELPDNRTGLSFTQFHPHVRNRIG